MQLLDLHKLKMESCRFHPLKRKSNKLMKKENLHVESLATLVLDAVLPFPTVLTPQRLMHALCRWCSSSTFTKAQRGSATA